MQKKLQLLRCPLEADSKCYEFLINPYVKVHIYKKKRTGKTQFIKNNVANFLICTYCNGGYT